MGKYDRDYDPEKDGWVHMVQPRRFRSDQLNIDPALCRNGREHEFASGECINCETADPYEDRPAMVHAFDTREDHICFDGCRHARTTEGRYLYDRPFNINPEDD